jgi:H+/Cl- antiporter ClcA
VTNASDEPAPGVVWVAAAGDQPPWPYVWHPPRAKVIVKADLLPAVSLLSFVALLGLAVGWIWARLAPPQRMRVLADRQVPLPVESYHRFDDLALFVLLCLGAGLITGLGVWLLRGRRGPVIMIAAVLGAVVAAWFAMRVGVSWAAGRYTVTGAPKVGDVVSQAPRLESGWALVAWPLTTALAYGVLSAWNGMDDLGRRLS